MPELIDKPTIVDAAGSPPKTIREYFGRINSNTAAVSIAHMTSPAGWTEPGQTPEFDEFTIVLSGSLRVESKDSVIEVKAGQGVVTRKDEWVRYSTPEGADYIAVCLPAFWLSGAHRDAEP